MILKSSQPMSASEYILLPEKASEWEGACLTPWRPESLDLMPACEVLAQCSLGGEGWLREGGTSLSHVSENGPGSWYISIPELI